jgi:hypothetical protein
LGPSAFQKAVVGVFAPDFNWYDPCRITPKSPSICFEIIPKTLHGKKGFTMLSINNAMAVIAGSASGIGLAVVRYWAAR